MSSFTWATAGNSSLSVSRQVIEPVTSLTTYDASDLTLLRARYLDPSNGRFLSRDPWPGDRLRPQSMNGWTYVENNPINLVDPSGRTPATPNRFPEHCRTVLSEVAYDRCVRQHFNPGSVNDNTPRRKFGIDAVGEFISVRF